MTELEKIDYARRFIEKLANGVDPLTDQPVPDGELVNNVRISRCFFYVADILRQVVENGGVRPPEAEGRGKKVPFFLSEEKRSGFALSDEAIPLSEIVRRLNDLIDPGSMKKLTYNDAAEWLVDGGFLSVFTDEKGARRKDVTPEGEAIGIRKEERFSKNGVYKVSVYSREAQEFLLDNLDSVFAFTEKYRDERKREKKRPWTREDEEELINLFQKPATVKQIAAKLNRPAREVEKRLLRLGLLTAEDG